MKRILILPLLMGCFVTSCSHRTDAQDATRVNYEVIQGKSTAPLYVALAFDQPPMVNKSVTLTCTVTPQADGENLSVRVILPKSLVPAGHDPVHHATIKPEKSKAESISCPCTVPDKTYQEITVIVTLTVGTAKLTHVSTLVLNPEAKPADGIRGKPGQTPQGDPIIEFQHPPK